MRIQQGQPYPLGSVYDGNGINFALFSADAQKVELCLFDDNGQEQRLSLPGRSGDVWHGYLSDQQSGLRYGYRVYGAWQPQQGLRFNPQKLLIDPYALALDRELPDSVLLQGGVTEADLADSASVIPKSVVVDLTYDWQGDRSPDVPWSKTVIYEAHVRGLTKLHPDIPQAIRGSYAAIAHPVMIAHLKKLGITALELLPVQMHADEPRLQQQELRNYWGYNVLAPFAVEPRYWSRQVGSSPLSEFRDMVKALHCAGIEVILDVVFNHTAELDVQGPTLSLRGIDNRHYYWLDDQGDYTNWTGCGNTLKLTTSNSIRWVLDCLRFWVNECHVDGFRFDLGTILGRTPDFSALSPLFLALLQDPALARCKLIAEPWDIGSNGYQLGQFPSPFAEWNDRFRDDMRRFWLHGTLSLGDFACRYAASSDYFNHHGRHPYASVNKITSHDGFTLRDLVSFNDKHNLANGEDNRDGNSENLSNNHGIEGLEADQFTRYRRQKSSYALIASLLLAQGTPMLLAGDEIGHSQKGNNNAYCQDNALTWLNWSEQDRQLVDFIAQLVALRQTIPALTADAWWQDHAADVRWLNKQGQPLTSELWQQGEQQTLVIQLTNDWLVVINATEQPVLFVLPSGDWLVSSPFTDEDLICQQTKCSVAARTIGVLNRQK